MKKYIILFITVTLLTSCSICSSIKARQLLQNCKFDIKSIEIRDDVISQQNAVLGLVNQLLLGNNSSPTKLDFDVILSVENPNDDNVFIDSLDLFLVVKGDSLSEIQVNEYVEIESKSTKDVPLLVSVPIGVNLFNASTAREFSLVGTVWMKFEIFSGFSPVFAVPVEMTEKF